VTCDQQFSPSQKRARQAFLLLIYCSDYKCSF
jgi:hypothetical protein